MMKTLHRNQLVKIVKDETGEFLGYYGVLVKKGDKPGEWAVDFTYNMVPLNKKRTLFGAYFEESQLQPVKGE